MQIIDSINNTVGLGCDNSSDTVGIVMKTAEDLGYPALGVFIPKFMLGYDIKGGEAGEEIDASISGTKCVNSADSINIFDYSVMIKNYIVVRPLLNQNQFMPEYVVGDRVIVKVIDNDLKVLMFYPYSINRLGQRAIDKLLLVIPSNPKENTALTEDNTYFVKLDSVNQKLQIIANNSNGETCKHTVELDPGQGIITITDNGDLSWVMDTNNDSITSKTSGTTIEQCSDVITMKGDTLNIEMDSQINVKTDTEINECETIKSTANDVTYNYDNYKQNTESGTWTVRQEVHDNTSAAFSGSTFHVDMPIIGLNGIVTENAWVIGSIPNVNIPAAPVNGQANSALFQTSIAAQPLAKAAPTIVALTALGAGCAAYETDSGAAASVVSNVAQQILTTRTLGQ